jgi:hypothetical protein
MPRAVAVGLPEPALQISAGPKGYQSHFSHGGERIWPETNCYLDLRIETRHDLGLDPVPAFARAHSADHDGLQWTFLKQQPEDLRQLSGLADHFFHLLAATPCSVRLQRCCDQAAPLGKVASVDSLGSATITASA